MNPSIAGNGAMRLACAVGLFPVVEALLADRRVDPAAADNMPVRAAAAGGHAHVISRLLADPRVDPSTHRNYALLQAAERGCVPVVAALLADPRVDPAEAATTHSEWPWWAACSPTAVLTQLPAATSRSSMRLSCEHASSGAHKLCSCC